MISGTLDQCLSLLDPAQDCLYTKKGTLNFGELRECALALRANSKGTIGGRIALCGLPPEEFIVAITAFDGTASTMLLLPDTLDASVQETMIQETSCTHRLDAGQNALTPIRRTVDEEFYGVGTRWLLVTSGTTGTPKIIEHSFVSLSRTVKPDQKKGRVYHWGLLYDPSRFAGLQVVLQALLAGSGLTLPGAGSFQGQVSALLHPPVNALSATPSMWRKLLMDGRIHQLNFRQITLGGEIADQAILNALQKTFPAARLTHIYASTEAGTGFAVNDGKAGFPVEWIDNKSAPILMRIDSRGHLLLSPPDLSKCEAIRERLDQDGYLDTEDLVSIRNGRVFFLGRASGVINVGGNKVNPEYIEQLIKAVSGVQDVKVYSKKSSLLGQLVAADIVAETHEEPSLLRQRVLEHCRSGLEAWQVPATIRFVSELSINATGKVERPTG